MNGLNLGYDPSQSGIAALLGNVANSNAPGTATYNSLQNTQNPGLAASANVYGQVANTNNPTNKNLNAMASGALVGNNPYLEQSIANNQAKIAENLKNTTLPGLQSQAAAFGRSGSGAFASQLNSANATAANEMAKVATDMYANQYNTDINSMLNANTQLSSNYNNDQSNKLNAANQLNNAYATNAQTQLSAANANDQTLQNKISNLSSLLGQQSDVYNNGVSSALNNANLQLNAANAGTSASQNTANTQLSAAQQAANAYQNLLLPAETIGSVGASQDAYAQDALNAAIQQWDYTQQMPLQQLANFASILNGGGYNSTTSTTSGGSALGNIMGGLTSVIGLGAKLSDVRMKENIKYLYTSDNGYKIYSYNYIGENENHIGPMAHEVREISPEKVIEYNGKLFIDKSILESEAA